MPSHLNELRIQLVWPKGGLMNSTSPQIKEWVKHAGGHLIIMDEPQSDITHFVCDKETWLAKKEECEAVWAGLPADGMVKAVSTAWFEECLSDKHRARHEEYLWSKLLVQRKNDIFKQPAKDGEIKTLIDVFAHSTAPHVGARVQAELDAHFAAQAAAEEELQLAKKREANQRKMVEAAQRKQDTLARGSKTENQIFAEENHVYRSADGFSYSILLTKADVLNNTNDRTGLTLYESNSEPHLYSCNFYLVGNSRYESCHELIADHTNLRTALRQFKEGFKQLTYLDWHERLEHNTIKVVSNDISYADRPWTYRCPLTGPMGVDEIEDYTDQYDASAEKAEDAANSSPRKRAATEQPQAEVVPASKRLRMEDSTTV